MIKNKQSKVFFTDIASSPKAAFYRAFSQSVVRQVFLFICRLCLDGNVCPVTGATSGAKVVCRTRRDRELSSLDIRYRCTGFWTLCFTCYQRRFDCFLKRVILLHKKGDWCKIIYGYLKKMPLF